MNRIRSNPPLWLLLVLLATIGSVAAQSRYTVKSPDGRIEVGVTAGEKLAFSVNVAGQPVLKDSSISMRIDGRDLGPSPKVESTSADSVDRQLEPVVHQKASRLRERYNQLRLVMAGNWAVSFRAYNEGVAYRFETSLAAPQVTVDGEESDLNFAGDYSVYYPKEEGFFSHNEREFVRLKLSEIDARTTASLPAVVEAGEVKVAIADSDIEEYPGMWLRGDNSTRLVTIFPPYPLEEKLSADRNFAVTKVADYIAKTRGTRTYPWRILGIAPHDGDLITNSMVWLLDSPSKIEDTSWIRPGKVAWDWYNANNLFNVDFKAGINTETYKYYIDFASKYGLEYIILDEGWYKLGDLLSVVPDINIEELVAYGKQKHVGIILWAVWKTLDDQFDTAMPQFEKWGIQGIKVDFMQRDDQKMIDFYHRLCRDAAKRHMLVDFHGGVRPATMTRTWPNLISTEGVRGLEQYKWSTLSNPEHEVTIPFTRMFMGPMDFTPGAMRNAQRQNFAPIFQRPMSLGTRCHQLAMYAIYESPLQMLADSPSQYLRDPEVMEYLGPVPSVWDETRVLDAKIGDYVVVARRNGGDWYVGAMTDWTPRDLEIDLSFLPQGSFEMISFEDGINAARYASDYKKTTRQVNSATELKLHLAPGGGWAARIRIRP